MCLADGKEDYIRLWNACAQNRMALVLFSADHPPSRTDKTAARRWGAIPRYITASRNCNGRV